MPPWFPDWRGSAAVIVASGPSAVYCDLPKAQGRCRFIAVNSSWRLCPWADALYACDYKWWETHKGVPEFEGLKVSVDVRAARAGWGVHLIEGRRSDNRMLFEKPNVIGWGANSGYQALNWVAQAGANPIALVGFDATVEHGEHWHGRHGNGMNNPRALNCSRWRKHLDAAAKTLADRGLRVVNCSAVSTLTKYERMTWGRWLELVG